jgi:5-methylcytosine-specific restriction protein A
MPQPNAIFKKLASSELGRGHTSGIVPAKETERYFGTPRSRTSHTIKKIVVEFWHGGKNSTIETNVNYFHSATHKHIHITGGRLMSLYRQIGGVVGDAVVFWKMPDDDNHFKAELIKRNSTRWAEIDAFNRNFARDKGGHIFLSPPDFLSASHKGDTDALYQIDSSVSTALSETDFPPAIRSGIEGSRRVMVPPRDRIKGNYVLKKQNYKCQIDQNHDTFTTKNGNKYMEKHHLIPMEYYAKFEYNIDDISNIVSLCPTCHRKIHLGIRSEKESMIRGLFAQQKDAIHARLHTDIDADGVVGLYITA